MFGSSAVGELDHDLTRQHPGEPLGERIVVCGRVLGADGKPLAGQLVEVWQANAAGRYRHDIDRHEHRSTRTSPGRAAPHRRRRLLSVRDDQARGLPVGQPSECLASEPHPLLALRPRLHRAARHPDVLPGDPLFEYDPIYQSVRDERARARMVAKFDLGLTVPDWALGYRFDIVLGSREATPLEEPHDE